MAAAAQSCASRMDAGAPGRRGRTWAAPARPAASYEPGSPPSTAQWPASVTRDVHEHGKTLVERGCAKSDVAVTMAVYPSRSGTRFRRRAMAARISSPSAPIMGSRSAMSRRDAPALGRAGLTIPVCIGGRLNQIPDDSNPGLPVDVTAKSAPSASSRVRRSMGSPQRSPTWRASARRTTGSGWVAPPQAAAKLPRPFRSRRPATHYQSAAAISDASRPAATRGTSVASRRVSTAKSSTAQNVRWSAWWNTARTAASPTATPPG